TKYFFCRLVEDNDALLPVDGNDRVHRRLDDAVQPLVRGAPLVVRALQGALLTPALGNVAQYHCIELASVDGYLRDRGVDREFFAVCAQAEQRKPRPHHARRSAGCAEAPDVVVMRPAGELR